MPHPKPPAITLSQRQQSVLKKIVRRQSSSQQLVRRAQIILLIAQDKNNQQIARVMHIHRQTVRQWRTRWLEATPALSQVEMTADDKGLRQWIETLFIDEQRPGTPSQFSLEQIVEILAIACEPPDKSGYPISHWTPQALKAEAIKRSIALRYLRPPYRAFFKIKQRCNRIGSATGSMPIPKTPILFKRK